MTTRRMQAIKVFVFLVIFLNKILLTVGKYFPWEMYRAVTLTICGEEKL